MRANVLQGESSNLLGDAVSLNPSTWETSNIYWDALFLVVTAHSACCVMHSGSSQSLRREYVTPAPFRVC